MLCNDKTIGFGISDGAFQYRSGLGFRKTDGDTCVVKDEYPGL